MSTREKFNVLTKEDLETLYWEPGLLPVAEIAAQFDVWGSDVLKRLRALGIKVRTNSEAKELAFRQGRGEGLPKGARFHGQFPSRLAKPDMFKEADAEDGDDEQP